MEIGSRNEPSELQEAMECGVCFALYDKPVQLGCGHTYCQSCVTQLAQVNPGGFADLDNLVRHILLHRFPVGGGVLAPPVGGNMPRQNGGTVSCPECRHVTTIPPAGLPVNFKLQGKWSMEGEKASPFLDLIRRVKSKMERRGIGHDCIECQAPMPGHIYFACKQCPEKNAICSLCVIRKHNGHEMTECQFCSADDIKRFRSKINHLSFNAKEQLRLLKESCTKIAVHCAADINLMEKELEQFGSLEKELEKGEAFTEDDGQQRVQRAAAIADAYMNLATSVSAAESQLGSILAAASNRFSAEVSRALAEKTIMNTVPKNEPSEAEAFIDIADDLSKSRGTRAERMEKTQSAGRNKRANQEGTNQQAKKSRGETAGVEAEKESNRVMEAFDIPEAELEAAAATVVAQNAQALIGNESLNEKGGQDELHPDVVFLQMVHGGVIPKE